MRWLSHMLDTLFPPTGRRRLVHNAKLSDVPIHARMVHTRTGTQVYTCMPYNNELVRALIHAVKFDADTRATQWCIQILTDALTETIAEHKSFGETVVLACVPASSVRKKERGHDHVHTIVAQTAHTAEVPFVPILVRTRETKRQMTLSAQERLHNMKNAFEVAGTCETLCKGAHVIVVDDVVTTGATLAEASRACRKAGAGTVTCIALAHA